MSVKPWMELHTCKHIFDWIFHNQHQLCTNQTRTDANNGRQRRKDYFISFINHPDVKTLMSLQGNHGIKALKWKWAICWHLPNICPCPIYSVLNKRKDRGRTCWLDSKWDKEELRYEWGTKKGRGNRKGVERRINVKKQWGKSKERN